MSGEAARRTARERLAALIEALGLEASAPAPCPYLRGREARMVAVQPERLSAPLYQSFLDLNFRRLGPIVYRPACAGCRECRQLRVEVAGFTPTRAQRRCRARNGDVEIERRRPQVTDEGYRVYRSYLEARHDGQMNGTRQEFEELLRQVTPFTEEVVFRVAGRLLGAGLFDVTPLALSAVYFYFEPTQARRSPGVFHILWLLDECRRRERPWLYLGYHVAGCAAMEYKGGFRPNQRLGEDGGWR